MNSTNNSINSSSSTEHLPQKWAHHNDNPFIKKRMSMKTIHRKPVPETVKSANVEEPRNNSSTKTKKPKLSISVPGKSTSSSVLPKMMLSEAAKKKALERHRQGQEPAPSSAEDQLVAEQSGPFDPYKEEERCDATCCRKKRIVPCKKVSFSNDEPTVIPDGKIITGRTRPLSLLEMRQDLTRQDSCVSSASGTSFYGDSESECSPDSSPIESKAVYFPCGTPPKINKLGGCRDHFTYYDAANVEEEIDSQKRPVTLPSTTVSALTQALQGQGKDKAPTLPLPLQNSTPHPSQFKPNHAQTPKRPTSSDPEDISPISISSSLLWKNNNALCASTHNTWDPNGEPSPPLPDSPIQEFQRFFPAPPTRTDTSDTLRRIPLEIRIEAAKLRDWKPLRAGRDVPIHEDDRLLGWRVPERSPSVYGNANAKPNANADCEPGFPQDQEGKTGKGKGKQPPPPLPPRPVSDRNGIDIPRSTNVSPFGTVRTSNAHQRRTQNNVAVNDTTRSTDGVERIGAKCGNDTKLEYDERGVVKKGL